MKYVDALRDGELARGIAAAIAREASPARRYAFMEFCGGHTHAISRYGLADLLPPQVRMIHGPGCPVCVLPIGRVDQAIRLALEQGVTLCTYGDCLRVPASDGLSLMKAKARGGDIRMVYSPSDALTIARDNPGREVVFFAIGFETTTPMTAAIIKQAAARSQSDSDIQITVGGVEVQLFPNPADGGKPVEGALERPTGADAVHRLRSHAERVAAF